MLKIKEAIERIQSLYSKGVKSDDSRLSSRHIYSKLKTARSVLLSQKANKRQRLSDWCYHVLPCVEMVLVQPNQCPCEAPLGCKILRSKHKLPSIIKGHDGYLIKSINSLNLEKRYSLVELQEFKNISGNRYSKGDSSAFMCNDYLFLSTKKAGQILTVTACFEDMYDVYTFPSSCSEESVCSSFQDQDFRVDLETFDTIEKMTVEILLGVFNQSREDQTNDSKDNLTQESK
jgi:hypothetical protein